MIHGTVFFPNTFHRSFSFPSFNVKDLDTVDNGILDHLYNEIDKNDSDIIIAHFLGVDHCGHRYGPKHPEMARKLQQMNNVIKNVTEKLKNDTILLVLGDHGMTENGDHGGDSIQEISTALFFYSPKKLTTYKYTEEIQTVAQVDIVPTLSLLLGLPIPFSNLGKIISPLFMLNHQETCFNEMTDSVVASSLAAEENAIQVQRYLYAYNEISNELSHSFMTRIEKQFQDLSHMWSKINSNITESRDILFNISEEIIPVVIFLGVMIYKYSIKSQSVSAVCVKYGIFFVCVLTSLRWWLNIVSPNIVDRILKGNEVILTRSALLTCIIMFIILTFFPILVEKPWEIPSKEIYCGSFCISSIYCATDVIFGWW
ncbi:GPI ethanolamine phosphate transferase 3 [Caerostris extrusa]|uniref:GPI ethanolamine phosphate transferase 3 n=1 Tax=Caerostris extrusa TaxID=172846 RepID=A0AAV4MZL2_CAEEX|nr:GPI ethanolamine phosphate transferase 3 [Caerostris extrusa]